MRRNTLSGISHLVISVRGRPSGGKRGPQPVYVCGGCVACASCCLWLTVFVSCKYLVMPQPVNVCVVCVCGVLHAPYSWRSLYVVNVLWCLSLSMQVVSSLAKCFIIAVAGIPVLNATWLWLMWYTWFSQLYYYWAQVFQTMMHMHIFIKLKCQVIYVYALSLQDS